MRKKISVYYGGGVASHVFLCKGKCESCDFRFQCYTERELVLHKNDAYILFREERGFILNDAWGEVLYKAEWRWKDLSPVDSPHGSSRIA